MRRVLALAAVLAFASTARAATPTPAPPPGTDADTRAWWATTAALSGDDMEGRDTGSPAYARAAAYVARRFAAAGLKPAGERGFLQSVPLKEVQVEKAGTFFHVARTAGDGFDLAFLHQISVR